MLLGIGAHRPGEASTKQGDLVESTRRTSQDWNVLGKLPEGGGPVLSMEGSQRLR